MIRSEPPVAAELPSHVSAPPVGLGPPTLRFKIEPAGGVRTVPISTRYLGREPTTGTHQYRSFPVTF